VRAARLSYVGEAGWEITCRWRDAPAVIAAMIETGAKPDGLFAQTSMRIEKGFCAMGHELDSDTSPIEAGLDAMTRKQGGFFGAEAMAERKRDGAFPRIISIAFDDDAAVPLGHEPIYHNGTIIGQTTSCAYGYRIGRPVALGSLRTPLAHGTNVQIDIAGIKFAATMTVGALFDPDGARMTARS